MVKPLGKRVISMVMGKNSPVASQARLGAGGISRLPAQDDRKV
jgi:hypothetical protein